MKNYPVPAAERTIHLLELLLQNPDGITAQDCLAHLDISRSGLFDLLRTLKALGYVESMEQRGLYRAGPRLLIWRSTVGSQSQDLLQSFYQEANRAELDETLALVIPADRELLVLGQVESSQFVRCSFDNEQTLPTETTAGTVLMEEPGGEVLRQGYRLERTNDLVELALPVCADGHTPQAALLLSAPAYRMTEEAVEAALAELRQMAARLSYRLGAQYYTPYQQPLSTQVEPAVPLSGLEMEAFLKGPWAARLACLRPDGSPHVVPVWHEWDGGAFFVVAWEGSRWGEYLLANPRLSLTIDEPWPPLRRVSVQGNAELLRQEDNGVHLSELLDRLSQRYLGQPLQPWLEQRTGSVFRILPERMRGWRGLKEAV